jgi:hypothetical protein
MSRAEISHHLEKWIGDWTAHDSYMYNCVALNGLSDSNGMERELNLTKCFVFRARPMEKRVQNIRTEFLQVQVISESFAQSHSVFDCMYVFIPGRRRRHGRSAFHCI